MGWFGPAKVLKSFQRGSRLTIDEGIDNLDVGDLAHIPAIAGFVVQRIVAEQDKVGDLAWLDAA